MNQPNPSQMLPCHIGMLVRLLAFGLFSLLSLVCQSARANESIESCIEHHSKGQVQRDEVQLLAAQASFRACAVEECPAPIRSECEEFLRDVTKLVPSVVLSARDDQGRDLEDVKVELDGETLNGAMGGVAIDVDPGRRSFVFRAADGRVVEQTVVVREGLKAQQVAATFPAPATPVTQTADVEAGASSGAGRSALPLVFAGVGVAALASFSYFALTGRSKHNDLKASCAPDCTQAQADEVSRSYLLADISLVVAAASLGAGAYFYFTPQGDETSPGRLSGATLNVGGRF